MTGERVPDSESVSRILRFGRKRLALSRIETPELDAEVLLRHVLSIDRTELFARLLEPVAPDAVERYKRLIAERARDLPVAYLTGVREFMGLSFAVRPGVLIPRPETEILVEWAIDWLRLRSRSTVVDVGTGSGAIALSLAAHCRSRWQGRVIAADVSPDALAIASQNRGRFNVEGVVALVQGSLISWLNGPADLVLANLPYLRPDQIAENQQLAAEPPIALNGGADGLDLIRWLLTDAPRVLAAGGAVGLEIDPSQRQTVVDLAQQVFPSSDIQVLRDLAGLDRHVTIQTTQSSSAR